MSRPVPPSPSLDPGTPLLPCSEEGVARVAAAMGFVVPDACMPGVVANLAILARHADTLRGFPGAGPT